MFKLTVIVPLTTGTHLTRTGEVEAQIQVLSLYESMCLKISEEMHEMGVGMASGTTPRINLDRIISHTFDSPTAFATSLKELTLVGGSA